MPFLKRPCGSKIYYEVKGKQGGIPVLLLAPGGMRSSIPKWDISPYNPWTSLPESKFQLIGMDQRFANRSVGNPVRDEDNWETFLADQIALLDHLEISRGCNIVGSCIGPSYAFNLLKHYPQRFGRCVMLQPIGLAPHTTEPNNWQGLNAQATWSWVGDWAMERLLSGDYKDKGEDETTLRNLHDRMFQSGRDFVFSITREEAKRIETPLLVFPGRDINHPAETAREICRLCPNAEFIEEWRDVGPEKLEQAATRIEAFLETN